MPASVTTRVISYAGSSVRIDCCGGKAADIVDFLYRDLPSYEGPPPHIALKVRAEPELGKVSLRVGKVVFYRGDSLAGLASTVLGQTLFNLADKSQGGLLLHAAAVARGDRAILLPGKTGAGKSTLTAWLMKRGFEYLTDELVYIRFGSTQIEPFVRPLNIKAPGRGVLAPDIVDFDAVGSAILSGPDVTLVPPGEVGKVAAIDTTRLTAVVFPRFETGARFRVEPVSRAQTGLGLMGCLINARNLPHHGFSEVTRLVRDVPGYQLEYGDFSQLEDWADSLAATAPGV